MLTTKTGTFQKKRDFQRNVYAMLCHSVDLPVSFLWVCQYLVVEQCKFTLLF